MAKQPQDSMNDDGEITMAQVLARMARIQEENHALQLKIAEDNQLIQKAQLAIQQGNQNVQREQTKQTRRPSNLTGPRASVYNPRGEKDFPMPALKCEVWMPFPQRPELHGLDREEVELMNLLIEDVTDRIIRQVPTEYPLALNDDSTVTLCLEPIFNRTTRTLERIRWCGPTDPDTRMPTPFFTSENRQQFRPLRAMLRELLGEEKTAHVLSMTSERKKVAAFASLDPIDRTDKTTYGEAHVARPDASHTGPLAFSIGE